MAKFFILASLLLIAAVSARKGGNDRGKFFEPKGPKGPKGPHGGHKGPGGPRVPVIPPFLSNITEEAWKEFFQIIQNVNLTKTELETEVRNWATAQGEEVAQRFEEFLEKKKQLKEEITLRITELLSNTTEAFEKLQAIDSNTGITRLEEMEQIRDVMFEMSPGVMNVLKTLGIEAMKGRKPLDITPGFPGFPDMGKGFPKMGGFPKPLEGSSSEESHEKFH